MKSRPQTITTINLDYEQLFIFDGGTHTRVRVLYGATWLTEEGWSGDAIVRAGDEVGLHGGRALVEALGPTRLQIVETGCSGIGRRTGRWLRRAARSARRQLDRLHLGAATPEPSA